MSDEVSGMIVIGSPEPKSDHQIARSIRNLSLQMDVVIKYKDESRLMRFLGALMFFAPTFRTNMATTINRTIYLPSREWARDSRRYWMTMAHELVHVEDAERQGFVGFALSYLFPQCLSLLSVLAFVPGMWWMVFALLFLAPIPSPGRARAEFRGYAISMACLRWRNKPSVYAQKHIFRLFTGPAYYYMWPFPKSVRDRLDRYRWMACCDTLAREIPIATQLQCLIQDDGARRLVLR
jgi:hypothetical protein